MILNLYRRNWKTVANLAVSHPDMQRKLGDPLGGAVSQEFKEYYRDATESVLKKLSPDDRMKRMFGVHCGCLA